MLIPPDSDRQSRRSAWRLIAIANIAILLCGAAVIWGTGMIGSEIDTQGWIAVTIALVATSALGSALMALSFYSSRSQRDEAVSGGRTDAPPDSSDYRRRR